MCSESSIAAGERLRVLWAIGLGVLCMSLSNWAFAQSAEATTGTRHDRIARLAAECERGSLESCRTVLPTLVAARRGPSTVVDGMTGETVGRDPRPLPSLEPLLAFFVAAVRARAGDAATPVSESAALAREFPGDAVLATVAREQLVARGNEAELRERACAALAFPDVLEAMRRHPREVQRAAFGREVSRCLGAQSIQVSRPRWAAIVDALGPSGGAPAERAWVALESAAFRGPASAETLLSALRAQPDEGRPLLAEAVVTYLRSRPAAEQHLVDDLVTALPGLTAFVEYQRELADAANAAQARQDAAAQAAATQGREAEAAAQQALVAEQARRQAEARASEAEAVRQAAAAREDEAQQRRAREAAERARTCQTRCRTVADACSVANPSAVVTRCLPDFEQCQRRCGS